MFKSKKELKKELSEVNSDLLYYRGKVVFLADIIKQANETNENPYITMRKIKDLLYSDVTYNKLDF
jgi:hypothetical protein